MHFMISTTRLISFSHTHGSGIEPLNQMMLTLQSLLKMKYKSHDQSINQHMKNITNPTEKIMKKY
jgi:hypothetical protein